MIKGFDKFIDNRFDFSNPISFNDWSGLLINFAKFLLSDELGMIYR